MKAPKYCPLCDGQLMYSSGDGMWDNTYHCGIKKHSNFEFSTDVKFDNSISYIQIYERDSKIALRWTVAKYGDIPPDTITIGTDFSPYKNERIDWNYQSPLMEKFKEIIKKLEIREIFY